MWLMFCSEDSKNSLATQYRQSQLYRTVMEELEGLTQSVAGAATGNEQAPAYVTSFLYQVNVFKFENFSDKDACFLCLRQIRESQLS